MRCIQITSCISSKHDQLIQQKFTDANQQKY